MKLKIIVIFLLLTLLPAGSFAQPGDLQGKLISSIDITGNYPYVDFKIRKYLTVRTGDVFSNSFIDEQAAKIKDFYDKAGYQNTTVTHKEKYNYQYDSVEVTFDIDRGYMLRYRKIDVVGHYSLPRSLVSSKINTWGQYNPRKLRESISKITHVYRMSGYPLARVRLKDKKEDYEGHKIDITIEIEEGPHVSVDFVGNKHLGGEHLKKIITIFSEGAIDSYELENSAKIITKRYGLRGFPNANVDFKKDQRPDGRINIVFNIDEGKPERVRNIFFEGNAHVSDRRLIKEMWTKPLSLTEQGIFNQWALSNDAKNIDKYYRSVGFMEENTSEPVIEKVENDTQLNITVPISEGDQTIINVIKFSGDIKFAEKELKKVIKNKEGKPLNANILKEDEEALVNFYADRGYPYAEVVASRPDPIGHTARGDLSNSGGHPEQSEGSPTLTFTINPGPLVKFGDMTIEGDFLTSQKAIRKAIGIKEGQEFSYSKLVNGKISLRRLGAFLSAEIDPQGMDSKATVVPLKVRVEEMKPFKLDIGLGYSTDSNFIGNIEFVNRNAFGWGKQAKLSLTGGKRYSAVEIGWIDPKFLGHDLEFTASPWLKYQQMTVYTYVQAGGGVSLYRKYHRTSYMVKVSANRNDFVKGDSTAADAYSLRNSTIMTTALSASFDTRNNFADPQKGLFLMGYNNFYDEIKGREANFVKFGVANGLYYTFWDRITLANEFRFENIQTFGKNVSVPSNELFLLGGDYTIRGYDRYSLGPVDALGRPTGGRLRFYDNLELRIRLFDNFKWVFFHDMGFLTNSYHAVTLKTLRGSLGIGLHYITPIGPIQLDYGFKEDRVPGESIGRLHLTFGYNF